MYLFTEAKKLDVRLTLQLSSSTDKDEKKVSAKRMKIGTHKDLDKLRRLKAQ